ncbi:MAG TPA: C-type lectin domain-containing protein [Labilithrix sp.]|nr:C-type lectin domain-containing protein [Labilithrix sp.]
MRVAGAAIIAVALGGAFVLGSACLPDLSPFPAGPDASASSVATQSLGCGDGLIETLDDGGDGGESCDPGEAGAAGCESCRFTCSGGIDDAGHCYFFADPMQTYNQAVTACRGAAGHVVTFASVRESAFASALVGDGGAYWVGLADRPDLGGYGPPSGVREPGWPRSSASCTGCFALGADDAGAFALHPAEDAGAANQCLVAENGTWLRVECNGTKPRTTLCEREPIGQRIYPCGGLLCTTISASSKRYVVWPSAETAEQARALCETTYDGGALVMLDTAEEREQLAREMGQRLPLPLEVWIGLSSVGGVWQWDDGDPTDSHRRPLPWGDGEPGSATGRAFLHIADDRFDTQLARSDEDAGATRVFVCQRPL